MGLSGSGKTTLATELSNRLKADHINADVIRKKYNDWDFSKEGRIRQATRLKGLATESANDYVVIDFICPLTEGRDIIDADYVIWMNTVTRSKYKDTDGVFEQPSESAVHTIKSLKVNVNNVILEIQGL